MPILLTLITLFATCLMAKEQPIEVQSNFNWGLHAWTIPLTILFGVAIGWALRDRKAELDDARAEMLAMQEAEAAESKEEA